MNGDESRAPLIQRAPDRPNVAMPRPAIGRSLSAANDAWLMPHQHPISVFSPSSAMMANGSARRSQDETARTIVISSSRARRTRYTRIGIST